MWVYAIANKDRIYIGQTNNLKRRIEEHNGKYGNHYTAKIKGEWKIVYCEKVGSRREAIIREKKLKSFQGREFIKNLLQKRTSRSPVAQR